MSVTQKQNPKLWCGSSTPDCICFHHFHLGLTWTGPLRWWIQRCPQRDRSNCNHIIPAILMEIDIVPWNTHNIFPLKLHWKNTQRCPCTFWKNLTCETWRREESADTVAWASAARRKAWLQWAELTMIHQAFIDPVILWWWHGDSYWKWPSYRRDFQQFWNC